MAETKHVGSCGKWEQHLIGGDRDAREIEAPTGHSASCRPQVTTSLPHSATLPANPSATYPIDIVFPPLSLHSSQCSSSNADRTRTFFSSTDFALALRPYSQRRRWQRNRCRRLLTWPQNQRGCAEVPFLDYGPSYFEEHNCQSNDRARCANHHEDVLAKGRFGQIIL